MLISPPRPKGPPLNALRAFEAAARLGGFSQAAEELCVTPGAVSQHIKSLEEWAGVPLFERRSQGVVLTDIGADIINEFTVAFDALGEAVRSLRTKATQTTINIAALPSVAQLWLSPRLPKIRTALSNHKISVTALETPPNLQREMFDISIFIGDSEMHKNTSILKKDVIFPVCSPEIASRINSTEDLLGETWIYDALWAKDWALWMNQVAPNIKAHQNGPNYSLYSIAIEEAKNGAGILMGHECLVEAQLKNGDLVAPFAQKIPTGKSLRIEIAENASSSNAFQLALNMLQAS